MGSDNIFGIIAAILGIIITAAIALWHEITDWAVKVLFPWMERNLEAISHLVKEAFVWFDNNVAVPIRNAIKQAWRKLREYLLKLALHFERKSSSEWVRRWAGYAIKELDTGKLAPVRFEAVEVISPDELPPDVRAEWMKKGMPNQELNVTEIRDKQVEMDMTY